MARIGVLKAGRERRLLQEYITAREAAERYGYTADHWRYLARRNLIERKRSGGIWLLVESSVRAYKKEMDGLGKRKHGRRL